MWVHPPTFFIAGATRPTNWFGQKTNTGNLNLLYVTDLAPKLSANAEKAQG